MEYLLREQIRRADRPDVCFPFDARDKCSEAYAACISELDINFPSIYLSASHTFWSDDEYMNKIS